MHNTKPDNFFELMQLKMNILIIGVKKMKKIKNGFPFLTILIVSIIF